MSAAEITLDGSRSGSEAGPLLELTSGAPQDQEDKA